MKDLNGTAVVVGMMLGLAGCGGEDDACTATNNCHRAADGSPECDAGYGWLDPDSESLECVVAVVCGDGVCNSAENPWSCSADCHSCGDGRCDSGETKTSCSRDCCVPSCAGKQCGDDGCGGRCGGAAACDDQNVCTTDSCNSSNRCVHEPVEDQGLECIDRYDIKTCGEGAVTDFSCVDICLTWDATNNGFAGCQASTQSCLCVTYETPTTCTQGKRECTASGSLATCRSGASYGAEGLFWDHEDCGSLCRKAGYNGTSGCRLNDAQQGTCYCTGPQCPTACGSGQKCVEGSNGNNFCCAPNCNGKECGSDGCGGYCGSGCAAGFECNDGGCECRPECQAGSVCCGGSYCAGDCLYAYDCGCNN